MGEGKEVEWSHSGGGGIANRKDVGLEATAGGVPLSFSLSLSLTLALTYVM